MNPRLIEIRGDAFGAEGSAAVFRERARSLGIAAIASMTVTRIDLAGYLSAGYIAGFRAGVASREPAVTPGIDAVVAALGAEAKAGRMRPEEIEAVNLLLAAGGRHQLLRVPDPGDGSAPGSV